MKKEWTMEETVKMPVIALRGLTVFPNVLIHFDVSREISIKALEEAMASGDPVFLVGQKDIGVEYPEAKDLYTVGTVSNVRQILRTPGDNVRVMVEGGARGSLKRLLRSAPFLEAEVQPIQEEKAGQNSAKTEALIRSIMAYVGADSSDVEMIDVGFDLMSSMTTGNVDATILAQKPKLAPYIEKMRDNLAARMKVEPDQVNVKATTEEKLGFTGAEEGIAAHAVALLSLKRK